MKTSDFSYHLPKEFIAQRPIHPRDTSRLLVYHRESGQISHHKFYDLPTLLRVDDLVVVNRSRVIQARLYGRKVPSGGKVEILLLEKVADLTWQCMVGGKGLRPGGEIQISRGPTAKILDELEGPLRTIRFSKSIQPFLDRIGQVPLPPYIHETLQDPEKYQTVYSKERGSAAAPTAGLHFTKKVLNKLEQRGIQVVEVVLHIGLDTFAPVREDDPHDHKIHSEWCSVSKKTAELINHTKNQGGRIIAVGTTTTRSLETAVQHSKKPPGMKPFQGRTDLYILPGYRFSAVDCLLTNFHLPESTLLMMVSAFAGLEKIMDIYQIAIQHGYRFYSFGDAMLIE